MVEASTSEAPVAAILDGQDPSASSGHVTNVKIRLVEMVTECVSKGGVSAHPAIKDPTAQMVCSPEVPDYFSFIVSTLITIAHSFLLSSSNFTICLNVSSIEKKTLLHCVFC